MKVVFMGTPDFAGRSLLKLINEKMNIVGVFTQPDRPSGRGKKTVSSPVKILAEENNIPVFQPKSMRIKDEIEKLKALKPDICVVVAYGQILPKEVIGIPKFGCINLHGSLLPKYRGAAPIQWSIINGEKITGITSMYISEGLDEGDIILQKEMVVDDNISSGEMFLSMAEVGADLLVKTLKMIKKGTAPRTSQRDTGLEPTFAPMLSKKIGKIDFSKPAQEIHNLIRGLNPWPVATFIIDKNSENEQSVKVFSSEVVETEGSYSEAQVLNSKKFIVACKGNTFIEFKEVQLAGRKRVSGRDFLNGNHIKPFDILE